MSHKRNQANLEVPTVTPQNGHTVSLSRGHGAAPIPFSSHRPTSHTDLSEPSDPPELDVPRISPINFIRNIPQPDDAEEPAGDLHPSDELNTNPTVHDLLRLLCPISVERHSPSSVSPSVPIP